MHNNCQEKIVIKAMLLIENRGKLLLNTGYNRVKNERFFRLIGGTVNFGERIEDALKREIKEELDSKIENLRFLTIAESIFQYGREKRHEICFIYKGDLKNKKIYKKKSIHYIRNGEKFDAEWVAIEDILEGKLILYPYFNIRDYLS
jgi:ADP-ribose pyrophosphatase YjhB (NUDIX family)